MTMRFTIVVRTRFPNNLLKEKSLSKPEKALLEERCSCCYQIPSFNDSVIKSFMKHVVLNVDRPPAIEKPLSAHGVVNPRMWLDGVVNMF